MSWYGMHDSSLAGLLLTCFLVQTALAEGMSLPALVDARTYVVPALLCLVLYGVKLMSRPCHSPMAQQARDLQTLEDSLQSVVYLHSHLLRAHEYACPLLQLRAY